MMPWWQRYVTEARWFKSLLNPEAPGAKGRVSRKVAVGIGAVLLFFSGGFALGPRPAPRDPAHVCQTDPLRGVYNPKRLSEGKEADGTWKVLGRCKTIEGTVDEARSERDGDMHIRFHVARKWVSPANDAKQHGDLVLEYMPGDPWPKPEKGDHLRVLCTYVADHDHGWRDPKGKVWYWHECHPAWGVSPIGETADEPQP